MKKLDIGNEFAKERKLCLTGIPKDKGCIVFVDENGDIIIKSSEYCDPFLEGAKKIDSSEFILRFRESKNCFIIRTESGKSPFDLGIRVMKLENIKTKETLFLYNGNPQDIVMFTGLAERIEKLPSSKFGALFELIVEDKK